MAELAFIHRPGDKDKRLLDGVEAGTQAGAGGRVFRVVVRARVLQVGISRPLEQIANRVFDHA
jgi:hypothetical protein